MTNSDRRTASVQLRGRPTFVPSHPRRMSPIETGSVSTTKPKVEKEKKLRSTPKIHHYSERDVNTLTMLAPPV